MPNIIGPDFIALHVRDLEASTKFYTEKLGLGLSPETRPGITVFATKPIALAVRQARVNLDEVKRLGWGIEVWLKCDDADKFAAKVEAAGVTLTEKLQNGVVGRQFSITDPDGYTIRIHDGG
jgi:predicted enzyme related to lactoylglutathione lyase